MLDTYCEYIIKRKKGYKEVLAIAGIVLLGIILFYLVPGLVSMVPAISFLSYVAMLGIAYGTYKLATNFNIEYEYTLTGSDLDIDKITNRAKRKRGISVARNEIDIVAPLGSDALPSLNNVEIIDASSHLKEAKTYVMTVNQDTKKAIYFEPNGEMITRLKERNPKKVFTE